MGLLIASLWFLAMIYTLYKFHNQCKRVNHIKTQTNKLYGKEKRKEVQAKEGNDKDSTAK
jgi:hypothetical protein